MAVGTSPLEKKEFNFFPHIGTAFDLPPPLLNGTTIKKMHLPIGMLRKKNYNSIDPFTIVAKLCTCTNLFCKWKILGRVSEFRASYPILYIIDVTIRTYWPMPVRGRRQSKCLFLAPLFLYKYISSFSWYCISLFFFCYTFL